MPKNPKNRLTSEKSPYLLQHKDNPVNWYPWNDEAFNEAKKQDKQIFLSIGYSTCHWCHVMEKESFEDKQVASILNKNFISIKVDREERPDIDNIYMSVCQALTGGGGWPLTILMFPDKKPFYAGSYFPKHSREGRIGLIDLLTNAVGIWENERDKIKQSAEEIFAHINKKSRTSEEGLITKDNLASAYKYLHNNFDDCYGGFGTFPKFPSPHNYSFLLRWYNISFEEHALFMIRKSLKDIRSGGIFDQIGYGIHRYSTDEKWHVPHFEKMLYDQALIISANIEAFQQEQDICFKETVFSVFEYLTKSLLSAEGAFFSAEDADSEGKEGKFYFWDYNEIESLLTEDEFEFIKEFFHLDEDGNLINEIPDESAALNLPYLFLPPDMMLKEEEKNLYNTIRIKLYNHRAKRIKPALDDKILTDWNALTIAALAKASVVFADNLMCECAEKAALFIIDKMYDKDSGILYHRYREGERAFPGMLDDYAFFAAALIELYQSTFKSEYLVLAKELTDKMCDLFRDADGGGFFQSASADLLFKKKEAYDGAIPSGNSAALSVLYKMSKFTGNKFYYDAAVKTESEFLTEISKMPAGYTEFLNSACLRIMDSFELSCGPFDSEQEALQTLSPIRQMFIPGLIIKAVIKNKPLPENIPVSLNNYDKISFVLCTGDKCLPPFENISEVIDELNF